jgi:hypothetical protein
MARTLTVVFCRDSSRDRQTGQIDFAGYELRWPDGRPVAVGLDAFCRHGRRMLGLDRQLKGQGEHLLDLVYFPLAGRQDSLTRLPGHRVRRLMIKREGDLGRIHFIDGTPTEATFDLHRDEPCVVDWVGLSSLEDGQEQWFDFTTRPVESNRPARTPAVSNGAGHAWQPLPAGS